ncbi:MAG: NupC/NupG family nucleoside CNT transporter [Myxococcales bacterium]|nr:NupC/NupG family nucleoside CNT transporter [Myxococcales bacterium]
MDPTTTAANAVLQLRQNIGDVGALPRLQAIFGIGVLLGLCWLLRTRNPSDRFPLRAVVTGMVLQVALVLLMLKTSAGEAVFEQVNAAFVKLMNFSNEGARFLFGDLVKGSALVAFSVLPTIIFFSALMAVGYHSGVMVALVRVFSKSMARLMQASGAEALSAVGNIFVGQTEAPLMIRPFLARMTRSELHCIMLGGFANVAGGVMAAYVAMLQTKFPDIAGHLLAASVMSAPATIMVSKLLVPESETPSTRPDAHIDVPKVHQNVIDAAAAGASEGLTLALNVGAMLIAFIALVALANAGIGWVFGLMGFDGVTLQGLVGLAMAPVAWLIGTPWAEAPQVGSFLGIKLVLNEFVAYLDLATNLTSPAPLSPRAAIITAYALCGFANFSSIAIQIGGIAAMVPERRKDLASLGLRAMLGGSVVTYVLGALAGIFV